MIGAGIANPMMLSGGRDPLDELGKIERSVRMRSAATASFTRTFGVPTNPKKWSFNAWVKRASFSAYQGLFDSYYNGSNFSSVMFDTADKFWFYNVVSGGVASQSLSNAVYRDPESHMNVHVIYDSDNAVAADRCILFVDGFRLAITGSTPLGQVSYINQNGYYHSFGRRYDANYNFDGEMSNGCFVDGQAIYPSAFGQFHPKTGQWRPKSKAAIRAAVAAGGGARNGWGANGFFLPFDDATSLTTLGYDRSQSDTDTAGNNWTANNVSIAAGVTYDSLLDTPTNNHPVINQTFVANGFSAGTISDGGLKFTSSTTYHFTPCTMQLPAYGKWRADFIPQDTVSFVGLSDLDNGSGASQNIGNGYGWYGNSLYTGNAVAVQTGLATMAANDVVTVAVDMDALSAKWYKNGALVITQALTAGRRYAFACGDYYSPGGTSCYANFGQQPFPYAIGDYKALCAKNLKLSYPIPKNEQAFVARTDSGANVAATLAAAAPWSDWIKIYKRRDAGEAWVWQFSDDPTYSLDSASSGAKTAFPTLAGASYVAKAIRLGQQYGAASGRLNHVNGVADTIADGLFNSRKVVILKNEATGVWNLYHPDLTAGKLLYLEQLAGETADTAINTVTASGFSVAASLPTGTYRWISLAENEIFSFRKYVGNVSADGPTILCDNSPDWLIAKSISAGGASYNWFSWDSARSPSNPRGLKLEVNSSAADVATIDVDFVANGAKIKNAYGACNASGIVYISIAIGGFPTRYANAR